MLGRVLKRRTEWEKLSPARCRHFFRPALNTDCLLPINAIGETFRLSSSSRLRQPGKQLRRMGRSGFFSGLEIMVVAMGQGVPDAQDASVSFPRHLFAPHSLLLGSGLCLAAVGLAFYISHAVHAADLRERTIFLLHAAQIELNEELRQTRLWTEHAADCLTETTSVSPLALAEACSLLWPDGLLSVYGGRGGIPGQTIAGSGKDAAPSGGEADLLRRAETGAAAAFLIIDNPIRLGAAVRTAAAPARTPPRRPSHQFRPTHLGRW